MRCLRSLLPLFAAGLASAAGPADAVAIRALTEFARICEADGMLLWGKSLCGPMVLVDPGSRAAIANRPDPAGAFRQDGDIYRGVFPDEFTPANTSVHWGGQDWATVMMPLPTDPFLRVALVAHESFHRVQDSLGLSAPDSPNAHLETESGRLWLRLELRALARALRNPGPAGRQSASDAMLFRLYRHRLCAGSASAEEALEKHEGLAEYTGVFIALRATHEDVDREARIIEDREDSTAFARGFAYATGPALGLLLDRYAPGWRAQAASKPLDSLLIAALRVRDSVDLPRQAQQRAALYGYTAVAAAEHEREEFHQAILTDLRHRFLEGPTLDFPETPEMYRNFNPNALMPMPPHGIYYPTGTFTAKWGRIRVESGGALVAADNRSLRVEAPADPNARPITGPGWTLQLEPGWTIRPGERPGSFVVAPAQAR
jgi:hypothetical protein